MESKTVDDLFERFLERVEEDFGFNSVKQVMCTVWASQSGLTETEILEFTGLAPAEWAGIYHALEERNY